jgi:hypothetical protein
LILFLFLWLIEYGQIHNKKNKLDDDNESSVSDTSSGSIIHSTVSVSSKLSCGNIMKTACPLDSFYLEKSSHVLSVLFVVRNWQIKL